MCFCRYHALFEDAYIAPIPRGTLSQAIAHVGSLVLASSVLGALLELANVLLATAISLDCLLALRGKFRLPLALAGLLLVQRVLLVLGGIVLRGFG